MDELKQAWTRLEERNAFDRPAEKAPDPSAHTSSGVIEQLRRKVSRKLFYCSFFTAAFAISIPYSFPLISQVLVSVLFAAYLVGSILLYQELQVLNNGVDMSQDILHGMTEYRDRIRRVIHYEEVIALTLYPVSISGGFFLGIKLYDQRAEIMNRTAEWVILITLIVVFTLCGHWLSKRLNQRAFGRYLTQLDQNIDELKVEL